MGSEERTIELTVTSATDLKKLKKFGREQKCYVVAYIYPGHKQTTKADPYGGVNPTWNAKLTLTCLESDLHHPAAGPTSITTSSSPFSTSSHTITMNIYCYRSGVLHSGDKLVGSVTIPLHDVGTPSKAGGLMGPFDVHRPSGELQGKLNVSVKLGGPKRTLQEYEDPTVPRLSSYSSSDNFQGPSNTSPSPDTISGEDVVMGYPVSSYAFAPLGQMPMPPNQQQYGPRPSGGYLHTEAKNANRGPYGGYSNTGAQNQILEKNTNHGPYGDYAITTMRHHRRHHRQHGCRNRRANRRIGCRRRGGPVRLVLGGVMLLGGAVLGWIL